MHGGRPNTLTRRALLGRDQDASVFRPPWARPEKDFSILCDGCNKCIEKCPEDILYTGEDNLAALRFESAGCTFCGECVTVCPTGALTKTVAPPLSLEARVHGTCIALHGVTCRLCEEACDVVAIRFRPGLNGKSYPIISEDTCNGCGACVSRCPSSAIIMSAKTTATTQSKGSTMGNLE